MIQQTNTNHLDRSSEERERSLNIDLLTKTSNYPINDKCNPYLSNINDTIVRYHSQYPVAIDSQFNPDHTKLNQNYSTTLLNPTISNVVNNDVYVHNNQYQKLNQTISQAHTDSNIIAPVNAYVIDQAIDQNLLYHCELALKRHFSSNIFEQQHMHYDNIQIEKIIYEKAYSKDFSDYLLALVKNSSYLNNLMILLHKSTFHTDEEVEHMKLFNLSMNNKEKFPKGVRADEEFKALNKIKLQFYYIMRQLISKTGFFDTTANNVFLPHREKCIASIANVIHKLIFNNRIFVKETPLISNKGTLKMSIILIVRNFLIIINI
jgi:hypothetical protein